MSVAGYVTSISGRRYEYHIPHGGVPEHMRNLAKNLTSKIVEDELLDEQERRSTFGHVMRQLEADADAQQRMVGFYRGAKVKPRAAA